MARRRDEDQARARKLYERARNAIATARERRAELEHSLSDARVLVDGRPHWAAVDPPES